MEKETEPKKSELTKEQIIITTANELRKDDSFVMNRPEKGQQVIFKCESCGEERDFSNSVEYGAAVTMWKRRGNKCVMCYMKETGELLY
jgi:hypothetical protein